jgi:hypothetical protein
MAEEDAKPVVLRLLEELQNDLRGSRILSEWLGHGGYPVSLARANDRALVCMDCPQNRKSKWWETAKDAIAAAICEHLEVKNKLNMHVAVENDLGMCKPCGCCTRLKIHVPIEHIARHLPSDAVSKFPKHCWIIEEMELL